MNLTFVGNIVNFAHKFWCIFPLIWKYEYNLIGYWRVEWCYPTTEQIVIFVCCWQLIADNSVILRLVVFEKRYLPHFLWDGMFRCYNFGPNGDKKDKIQPFPDSIFLCRQYNLLDLSYFFFQIILYHPKDVEATFNIKNKYRT